MSGILVAVKSSEKTERVVRFAIEEAKLRGERVVLVHCVEYLHGSKIVEEVIKETAIKAGKELLEKLSSEVEAEGIECKQVLVTEVGDPGNCILKLAEELNVSLIVIGVRKRSPAGKLLFGSTAQHVILNSEKPVVCIK
jgi:nucleotide-binding universal stress UspA family protein